MPLVAQALTVLDQTAVLAGNGSLLFVALLMTVCRAGDGRGGLGLVRTTGTLCG